MRITSITETISCTPDKVFDLLVSFARTSQAPPIPQVTNWTSMDDGCTFTIAGMFTCSMRLTEQRPFTMVEYQVDTDKGISAKAVFHIEDAGGLSRLWIDADADAPVFMQAMIKKPMEQAMNKGLSRLKEMAERM